MFSDPVIHGPDMRYILVISCLLAYNINFWIICNCYYTILVCMYKYYIYYESPSTNPHNIIWYYIIYMRLKQNFVRLCRAHKINFIYRKFFITSSLVASSSMVNIKQLCSNFIFLPLWVKHGFLFWLYTRHFYISVLIY